MSSISLLHRTGALCLLAVLAFAASALATPVAPPTVADPAILNLTPQSALLGGTVTSTGGVSINEDGVVFSKTVENDHPLIDGTGVTKSTATLGDSEGEFFSAVTGLTPETQYAYRAYSMNEAGVAYSDVATFTTPKTLDFAGVDDFAVSSGTTRIYPLANDVSPPGTTLHLVSVNDSRITIEGRSLVIPAGYDGSFTYRFSDGTNTGQASVNVAGGRAAGARAFSGLLRDQPGTVAGSLAVAFTRSGSVATVVLQVGTKTVRTTVRFPFNSAGARVTGTRATALGTLTLTRSLVDGTIAAELAAPQAALTGILQPRHVLGMPIRYHIALAGTEAAVPGGGFVLLTIFRNGSVILTSALPDGSVFSAATSMREDFTIPLYTTVGRRAIPQAVVAGELVLAQLSTTDLTGEWTWVKPAQRTGLHRGGVNTVLTANGCEYHGEIPLAGGGTLSLSGGDLPAERDDVLITAGRPNVPAGAVKQWLVDPRYGYFRAGVQGAGESRAVLGRGVYLPKSKTAWGFFPGKTVGGRIVLSVP